MSLKVVLTNSLARLMSKSYYFTQFARVVVKNHDNDGNANMFKNGEVKVLKLILSRAMKGGC